MRKTPEIDEEVQRIRERREYQERKEESSGGYSEDEAGPEEKPQAYSKQKTESELASKGDL